MRKIPTLFKRDLEDMRRLTREVHPDCQWVIDGEGEATRKYDGTCVLYDEASLEWWARREVKPGKTPPPNFRAVNTDSTTGKTMGWEPIEQSAFWKAFQDCDYVRGSQDMPTGTYELCGPKVNGNPENFATHVLVKHGEADIVHGVPRDYGGLRSYLANFRHEGIVWHHPDGRMAKIKVRDVMSD